MMFLFLFPQICAKFKVFTIKHKPWLHYIWWNLSILFLWWAVFWEICSWLWDSQSSHCTGSIKNKVKSSWYKSQ